MSTCIVDFRKIDYSYTNFPLIVPFPGIRSRHSHYTSINFEEMPNPVRHREQQHTHVDLTLTKDEKKNVSSDTHTRTHTNVNTYTRRKTHCSNHRHHFKCVAYVRDAKTLGSGACSFPSTPPPPLDFFCHTNL